MSGRRHGGRPPRLCLVMPGRERPKDELAPGPAPATLEGWDLLRTLSPRELAAMGCRPWHSDNTGHRLMLFPAEWYDKIPARFFVTCIDGKGEEFMPGKTDDVPCMGSLSYGVVVFDRDGAA